MPTLKQIAREHGQRPREDQLLPMPVPEVSGGLTNLYTWRSIERFVVAQTERDGRKFFVVKMNLRDPETGHIDPEDLSYHLLVEPRPASQYTAGVPPSELYEDVGEVSLLLNGYYHTANIYHVQLVSEFQGKGLGTFMYKTTINDLVSSGWKVRSDTVRSPQATRVWFNLQQRNPGTVRVIPRANRETVFEANGIVHRRPNVKRHQRRSR